MEFLNRIELKGIVGRCSIATCGDKKIANFSLVTEHASRTIDGQAVIDTMWHNISASQYRSSVDIETIDRGDKLHVIGRLRCTRYTDAEGNERSSISVIASKVEKIED